MTLLLLLSAAPVSARPPDREPVPDARDEYAAGVVCAFPTLIETTANKEKATTFYDREGNVVRQLVTGKLRMRITNTATGESIDVNVSGPGKFVASDDGMLTISGSGKWLIYAFAGDAPGAGVWLTTGRVRLVIDLEDGAMVEATFPHNTVDVCALLAP